MSSWDINYLAHCRVWCQNVDSTVWKFVGIKLTDQTIPMVFLVYSPSIHSRSVILRRSHLELSKSWFRAKAKFGSRGIQWRIWLTDPSLYILGCPLSKMLMSHWTRLKLSPTNTSPIFHPTRWFIHLIIIMSSAVKTHHSLSILAHDRIIPLFIITHLSHEL